MLLVHGSWGNRHPGKMLSESTDFVRAWYNKEWSLGKQFPSSNWKINENCNAVEMCQFFLSAVFYNTQWVGLGV